MSIKSFEQNVDEVIQFGIDYRSYAALSNLNDEIDLFLPKLSQLTSELNVCINEYVRVRKISPEVDISFDDINSILEKMKSEITADLFSKFTYSDANSRIQKLRSDLRQYWKDYVFREISATESILKMTRSLMNAEFKTQTDKLLETIKQDLVATDKQVESLQKYRLLGQEYINSIDLSDNIVKFLEGISNSGYVVVNELSDSILSWLKQNGFSDKFIVKVNNY